VNADHEWLTRTFVNGGCLDMRVADLQSSRKVAGKNQIAWHLRAVQCIDLTTLAGDDMDSNVTRLCIKVRYSLVHTIYWGSVSVFQQPPTMPWSRIVLICCRWDVKSASPRWLVLSLRVCWWLMAWEEFNSGCLPQTVSQTHFPLAQFKTTIILLCMDLEYFFNSNIINVFRVMAVKKMQ
jgi:hypothetical protein